MVVCKKWLAVSAVVAVTFACAFVLLFPRPGHSAEGLSCRTSTQVNKPSKTVAECDAGEVVTGGGGRCYGFGGKWESFMVSSYPSGKGWAVICQNLKSGADQTVGEVYAICCHQ